MSATWLKPTWKGHSTWIPQPKVKKQIMLLCISSFILIKSGFRFASASVKASFVKCNPNYFYIMRMPIIWLKLVRWYLIFVYYQRFIGGYRMKSELLDTLQLLFIFLCTLHKRSSRTSCLSVGWITMRKTMSWMRRWTWRLEHHWGWLRRMSAFLKMMRWSSSVYQCQSSKTAMQLASCMTSPW